MNLRRGVACKLVPVFSIIMDTLEHVFFLLRMVMVTLPTPPVQKLKVTVEWGGALSMHEMGIPDQDGDIALKTAPKVKHSKG